MIVACGCNVGAGSGVITCTLAVGKSIFETEAGWQAARSKQKAAAKVNLFISREGVARFGGFIPPRGWSRFSENHLFKSSKYSSSKAMNTRVRGYAKLE
jgi:hypothetical protein